MMDVEIIADVRHLSGPAIDDPQHVAAWIVVDTQVFEHVGNQLRFEVCPTHADPEVCACDDEPSVYGFTLATVDVVTQPAPQPVTCGATPFGVPHPFTPDVQTPDADGYFEYEVCRLPTDHPIHQVPRCEAAYPEDDRPCDGSLDVVVVHDGRGGSVTSCLVHAATLLGPRGSWVEWPVELPDDVVEAAAEAGEAVFADERGRVDAMEAYVRVIGEYLASVPEVIR